MMDPKMYFHGTGVVPLYSQDTCVAEQWTKAAPTPQKKQSLRYSVERLASGCLLYSLSVSSRRTSQ